MTEDEAFKELAAQNLAGFGWTIAASDIPDYQSVNTVMNRLLTWWNAVDQDTRDIINQADLADGLWTKGYLTEWPGLYTLAKGNPFGRMSATLQDILQCVDNAHERAASYAAEHA